MPTYMLDGDVEIGLSVRPLTLSLRLEGATASARLDAVADGGLAVETVRPRSGLLVIPRVDDRLVVRVVSVEAPLFAAPTLAHLSIAVDTPPGGEPERAVLGAVSLDALASRDLLVIERVGDRIRVRAAQSEGPEVDLGIVGNAARVAATQVLGVRTVDPSTALNLLVAVDGSASTKALHDDGTIDFVVNVLAGLASVIAPRMSIGAAVVGADATPVPVPGAGDLAPALRTEIARHRYGSGLRSSSREPAGFGLKGRTMIYLVTDAVPADFAQVEETTASGTDGRHLIVVGDVSAWALQTHPDTPSTHVDAGAVGHTPAESALLRPDAMKALVTSLMAGCFPAGTNADERVRR
jgi:hypothetical protein